MRRLAMLLLLPGLTGAGENLLGNGGFEEGVAGWVFYRFGAEDARELERKGAEEGRRALHVTKQSRDLAMVWTDYALGPERQEGELAFSLRVRGKRLDKVVVRFIVWDERGDPSVTETLPDLEGSFKWKTLEKTLPIPGPAKGGRILLHLHGTGELWLDDARVVHTGAATEDGEEEDGGGTRLRNGGFDRSRRGWAPLPGSRALTAGLDRRTKADGAAALRLKRRGDRLYPELGLVQVVERPRRTRRVRLTCRARAEAPARACVALLAETEEGALVGAVRAEAAGAEFEELALPLALPASAARLRVVLAIRGPGAAWFDAVALERK